MKTNLATPTKAQLFDDALFNIDCLSSHALEMLRDADRYPVSADYYKGRASGLRFAADLLATKLGIACWEFERNALKKEAA